MAPVIKWDYYYIAWEAPVERRSDLAMIFAPMTEQDIEKDYGSDVKPIYRWHNLGNWTGRAILKAKNAQAVHKFCAPWTMEGLTVNITPVVDPDENREVITKTEPAWKLRVIEEHNYNIQEDENLYFCSWTSYDPDKKLQCDEKFSKMSEEDFLSMMGAVKYLGSFSDMSAGTDMVFLVAKSIMDVQKCLYQWAGYGDLSVEAMIDDKTCQKILKEMPGFEKKQALHKAKMMA